MCHVFVPQGHGEAGLLTLADALAEVFLRWPDPPVGLTIHRRLPANTGARSFRDRPWFDASFAVTYVFDTIG
jgi:hypothetical protein